MEVELDPSSYAKRDDLKGRMGIVGSNLAVKSDFTSLKAQVEPKNCSRLFR